MAVSVTTSDGWVEVQVADDGTGIADAEREHVFEAFYRAGDDASRSRGGAGLGLSIARAIVQAHGGRIWFAPAGRGTRVRFSLPAEPSTGREKVSPRLPTSSVPAG